MKLKLIRDKFTDLTTTGKLYIDGVFFGYVLEDVVRPAGQKVKDKTAIPYGTYRVTWEKSPRLSAQRGHDFYTPRLNAVPGFDGVLMHVGNYARDTSGCLLPGLTRVLDMVGSSGTACDRLYPLIEHACAHEGCTIEIIRA